MSPLTTTLLSYLLLLWVQGNLGHLACISSHLACSRYILSLNLKHVLFTFTEVCMCAHDMVHTLRSENNL